MRTCSFIYPLASIFVFWYFLNSSFDFLGIDSTRRESRNRGRSLSKREVRRTNHHLKGVNEACTFAWEKKGGITAVSTTEWCFCWKRVRRTNHHLKEVNGACTFSWGRNKNGNSCFTPFSLYSVVFLLKACMQTRARLCTRLTLRGCHIAHVYIHITRASPSNRWFVIYVFLAYR